ncbi:MAG: type II toxin-antitoxin system HicB family antitoxin [Chloroflexota bacterium]|nr:type II toxin-antitoxin system HicB family antitoxin [Chloroflexota bacterium]
MILDKPYLRVFIYDEESSGYTAMVLEFPGCITEGETIGEANRMLEEAAELWVQAAKDMRQDIPEPAGKLLKEREA